MDFKIVIKCEKCRCSFELRPVEFVEKDNLCCPNCGQKLQREVFNHLRAGLIEFSQVPDVVPEFSLEVKEYNELCDRLNLNKD